MKHRRLLSGIGWGAASVVLIAVDLAPAAAADFYQGKTLTWFIEGIILRRRDGSVAPVSV
jgi:hypothetical protein